MHLKKVSVIFSATLILLLLLLWFKNHPVELHLQSVLRHFSLTQKNTSVNSNTEYKTSKIETILTNRLVELEIPRTEISLLHLLEDSTITIEAPVPRGKPMEWILWYLGSSASKAGYLTADCFYQEEPFICYMVLKNIKKNQPTIRLNLTQGKKYFSNSAKLAIVVNDFSFQADPAVSSFFAFPAPLSISIIGSRKLSVSSADIAHEHQKEIILLLPMEPLLKRYSTFQNSAIMLHYPEDKIKQLINAATTKIPYYTGFSNLCGDRILNDSRVMSIIFAEVKDKNSYFLFNMPQQRSAVTAQARSAGIPFRFVDIFLDSSTSAGDNIADSLRHAALIAQKKGSAVFSAHATQQFQQALTTLLPYFFQNGIQLVPVSELVNHPQQ